MARVPPNGRVLILRSVWAHGWFLEFWGNFGDTILISTMPFSVTLGYDPAL